MQEERDRLAQTRGAPKLDREVAAVIIQKVDIKYHIALVANTYGILLDV